jgi:hypothetical protein
MSRQSSVIESLESRTFLAADLSVAFESTTLPDALVVGLKAKAATATLLVSNSGDAVAKTTKGNLTVSVGLRDANGVVTPIGIANVKASALAKGTPAKAKAKLASPATLAEGTYTLVAAVDGGTIVPDGNSTNNSVDGKSVNVSVANSDLSVAAATSFAGSVAAGTNGTVNVAVTNVGNVAAKATGSLTITSTVNGQTTTLLTVDKLKLNVKPGAVLNLKPLNVKAQNLTDANVSAAIGVALTSTASGDNAGNNAATPATITVTPPPPSPLSAIGVGDKMTFVKTEGTSFNGTGFESGNWTDSNGRTGTYFLTTGAASDGTCALTSNGTPLAGLKFTFNNGKTKLGGTSLAFGVDAGSAAGNVVVAGQTVFFTVGK